MIFKNLWKLSIPVFALMIAAACNDVQDMTPEEEPTNGEMNPEEPATPADGEVDPEEPVSEEVNPEEPANNDMNTEEPTGGETNAEEPANIFSRLYSELTVSIENS
ncbi:hypothetical protein [Priestia abyssalis]|uniref:hypothetical protein n=1 Tax=Priestia abyssalis TaxID=1221450 RepID=UPI0009956F51|nr:hypothetical protein [Priestia abyssalis]